MSPPPLGDTVIVLGLAIAVLLICHRLRVPPIVGLLLTGVVAGPHGFSLVRGVAAVEEMAEAGVVFLLFTIGLEFPLRALLQNRRSVLLGGGIQLIGTAALGMVVAWRVGWPLRQAVFAGMLLCLSSTAIVLKLLQQRGEADTVDGRVTFGVLILQDLAIVPMIVLTPLLAGAGRAMGAELGRLALTTLGVLAVLLVGARWVVPAALDEVTRTRDRELFLLAVVALGLGVAWLTAAAGLSPALGAFLAGLMVGQSPYGHHALGSTLALRDVFMSFFFVSVGMLLDVGPLATQPALWLGLVVAVILAKTLVAAGGGIAAGLPLSAAVAVGLSLCQIGEFSFILAEAGLKHGLLSPPAHQLFLAVSIATMALSPLTLGRRTAVAGWLAGRRLPPWLLRGWMGMAADPSTSVPSDHLLIIGLGFVGQTAARAAAAAGVPYHAVELNPSTVHRELARGHPVTYGDASHEAVLRHAGAHDARVAVIAIPDPATVRRVTRILRELNPKVHLVARTRFVSEIGPLHEVGADDVVAEEHEAAVEVLSSALTSYLKPGAPAAPGPARTARAHRELLGVDLEIRTVRVCPDAEAAGASLRQLALMERFSVTVLTVWRELSVVADLDGETRLEAGDTVVLVGRPEAIDAAEPLLTVAGCE